MKKFVPFILFVLLSAFLNAQNDEYVTAIAKNGDGISIILARYGLEANQMNIDFFKEKNSGKFVKKNGLIIGQEYVLPIKISSYTGKNIRSSLGINDYEQAKQIQCFNQICVSRKLKKCDYKTDKIIWVPLYLSLIPEIKITKNAVPELPKLIVEPLFGEKYKNITIINRCLSGCIFYIVSGHGGIDPGAVGFKDGHELHEDEYAYDVSLRFARRLMEFGAEVNVIVQDQNDGIRDEIYLKNSFDEYHIGNYAIPTGQNDRLSQRTKLINELYNKNKSKKKKQYCIETHVDSRYTGQMVDIFFYHKKGNNEGKNLAETLLATIKQKYDKAQPGRGYEGSVEERSLYMIRNVIPTFVFIEIGNIQNPRDQTRIIEVNNRQAMANWLCDGVICSVTGNK